MTRSRVTPFGELLLLRLRESRWSSGFERRLERIQPGGIVLDSEALRSPGQTAELLGNIARTLRKPPLLALAEEGGSVDPLRVFLPRLPAPRAVARKGPFAARRQGELIGAALRVLGFNLNFAPRLDLSNPHLRAALDTQTFGAGPQVVTACGRAFIEGLRRQKIFACAKHFPGQGATLTGKDNLPRVEKPMAQLWREELVPFRELLPVLPFVMLSNAVYKAYDFETSTPAAMSENIAKGLLRVKLGYRGVVVTNFLDRLEETLTHRKGTGSAGLTFEAFRFSLNAGCELHCVGWGEEALLQEMQKSLENGTLAEDRLKVAMENLRAVKMGLKRPSGDFPAREFDRLAREFEEFSKEISSGD